MTLRALALDFDGTIALDGRLDAEVAATLADLRARGVSVLLVTGRILDDLRCLLGSLRAFDAVVAEEGAVLAFPPSGSSRQLAPPVPAALLATLEARGLAFRAGQCLVECEAHVASRVIEQVRALELPLVLHFNRGRMMILPQAVSKATGLREALRSLRLSAHNALAIGDGENDHELLRACEVGVAVAWGSPVLREAADQVLAGAGPPAVAGFLRAHAWDEERLPTLSRRHRLLLGRQAGGDPVFLGLHGRNLLITGEPMSGKSWLAGLLAEQLVLQGYSLCVVDPEGDYAELGALPGVHVLGGGDPPPSARDLERLFAYPDTSVVIDLSCEPNEAKTAYVRWLMVQLGDLRRRGGYPHHVLLDEAHYFLSGAPGGVAADLARGGYLLVSYQASRLDPATLAACEALFVTRASDEREAGFLRELCGRGEEAAGWNRLLGRLELDEAVLLPGAEEAGASPLRFRLAPRLTHHVRHEHKYLDAPLAEPQGFRFVRGARRVARTLREFIEVLDCAPSAELDEHLRRGDFSRWVSGVFRDRALADRLAELEELHRLGRLADVNGALIHAIEERYRLELAPGSLPPA